MSIPFPFGKSSLFSLAEFVSRLLGLFFLAHFMKAFGLDAGGVFRTALPLIILASAVGSVGLPTALTRWLAADGMPKRLSSQQKWTVVIATLCAMVLTVLSLNAILKLSVIPLLGIGPVDSLLRFSVPLLLIMPTGGSLRGMLIGRGQNTLPAIAQACGAITQVALINPVTVRFLERMHWNGGEAGVAIVTAAETVAVLVLIFGMMANLYWHALIERRQEELQPEELQMEQNSTVSRKKWLIWRDLRTIFRLTASPTLQTLLETLGFGLELPMAEHLLTLQFGPAMAQQWLAEYAAVAIPLLHFPMFAADGLATALLPTLTRGRATQGSQALGPSLEQVVRSMFILSVPASLVLFVFAPTFSSWLDAPEAANLLRVMAPLALFAYAQSPLSAVVQAHGRSRALLYAGFAGDVSRLSALLLSMAVWHLGVWGLVCAFALGVSVETGVLYAFAWRITPIEIPWKSLGYSVLAGIEVCTVLIVAKHLPFAYGFSHYPLPWFVLALVTGGTFLVLSKEIPPQAFLPVPVLGSPLNRIAKVLAGTDETRSQ
ncbi:polysaccharide biosynthesis C-terminal domain-containing protein [Alicyclobacillus curvatus]|nr:polysaccharide biosynthesis C-terminal domain-containing protein [Alicyclobacillus curvatus]